MELSLKLGGIDYDVEVDIDDECVCDVFSVSVWDGEKTHKIKMDKDDLANFYKFYQDNLQEAYEDHKVALEEMAAEERWERQNDR